MKPTYQIKDWDKHFENHESRKVKRSYWVPVPNRHDGKSYRRIAAHTEGVAVFAGWILILEAASKMPTRGVLADEDGPLDAEDLSAMTGFPASIFDAAFNLLTQERFGWLSIQQNKKRAAKSPAHSRNLPQSPDETGETALEQKGIEGNGTEGNRTKVVRAAKPRSPSKPKLCDEEYIEELQSSEAYSRLNVRHVLAKMVVWCENNGKQPTRSRLLNWLGREDMPIAAPVVRVGKPSHVPVVIPPLPSGVGRWVCVCGFGVVQNGNGLKTCPECKKELTRESDATHRVSA